METKEDFCSVCAVAAPMLIGGAATTAFASKQQIKERKKNMMIIGGISIFISLCLIIYLKYIAKCKSCV